MTGRAVTLNLAKSPQLLVIVEPGCDKCARVMSGLRPNEPATVLSLAPVDATRPAAQANDIVPITYSVTQQSLPPSVTNKLGVYPQIVWLENGVVTRTCADVERCIP